MTTWLTRYARGGTGAQWMTRTSLILLLLGVAYGLGATTATAQQTGSVSGTVVEEQTQSGLPSVEVLVVGTQLLTLTAADGSFVLQGVPTGTHEIRARRIGYRPATQTVRIRSGQIAELKFDVGREVLALDAIVVTGTAGAARRRELGNTISQINVADVREPTVSLDNLLQGKVAGLTVNEGAAGLASGAQIRLRGNISVAMSNQPLLYIDGVRVRSDGYPINAPTTQCSCQSNNDTPSPLNDLNPADIERVEIIKGPAATTLYGTEAAAGVIQIFTKRGRVGSPVWTLQTTQGLGRVRKFGPTEVPMTGIDPRHYDGYLGMDRYLRTGWSQNYSLSVGGGTEAARYYLSGAFEDNKGVLPLDDQQRVLVRGNLGFNPMENMNVEWSTSYTDDEIQSTPGGTNALGLVANVYRAPNNFLGGGSVEELDETLKYEITADNSHFITGLTIAHTPTSNFSNKLTVGYDRAETNQIQDIPFGYRYRPFGSLYDRRWLSEALTLDYVGNIEIDLTDQLSSKFSWGGQHITTNESWLEGYGVNFPGPGKFTVSGAATKLTFGEELRVINAGFFFQNLIGFKNRYFLTAGLRVDGNSAFGEDFGLQAYPKVSVSYVMSDEPFWPANLGQFKLRAAYGHAGRAPGAFDAVRTWFPEAWGSASAFIPGNVGAPDLGPERTAEFEIGFEGSFLEGRLTADFTHYRRKTSDALFNVTQIPTNGFLSSQLDNVGSIRSRGIELSVNASVLEAERFSWQVSGTISTNYTKVEDLGGAASFRLGREGWIDVDQPIPVMRGTLIENPDAVADPILTRDHNFGANQPTHVLGFFTAVGLPGGIQVSARGEYFGGHYLYDHQARREQLSARVWPFCDEARVLMANNQRDQLTARERALCDRSVARIDMFIWPADFFKFRDLTISVPVTRLIPRTSSAQFSLSLRNFWTITKSDFLGIQPEVTGDAGLHQFVRFVPENVPRPMRIVGSLRVTL